MSSEKTTPDHIPDHVIEAILNHIPFDGWSTASLDMAAADCGLSETETLFRRYYRRDICLALMLTRIVTAFHSRIGRYRAMPVPCGRSLM